MQKIDYKVNRKVDKNDRHKGRDEGRQGKQKMLRQGY